MKHPDLITPVILSGGSGTRLWPVSTEERPKQFLNLLGPRSMFQMTLERCQAPDLFDLPIIVGGTRHAALANEQIAEMDVQVAAHILEPCARNTAPAIALAALACVDPQKVMLVMPSDHMIKNISAFQDAVQRSLPLAKAGWLVTFGIAPSGPETGYGYIQQGEAIKNSSSFAAQRFVEKPNRKNAEKMLNDGGYHWNAGIFLMRADSYLHALGTHAPDMLTAAQNAMEQAQRDVLMITPDAASFSLSPSESIDYAVMEKAGQVAVTPVDPGWSDVGSWDALFEISKPDDQSNVITGDVMAIDATDNLIHADGYEVAALGVNDLIIIASGNKIMVMPRGRSQDVKTIVSEQQHKE
ncbi:mannose-1-phosphate guanylyltransferase/mannose-6-phosphate isomerase [Parasphingorhabdus sp. JC815]|uniref:mannose-1-phosphate guanylyltransferase/mannose-6-phosphate isomerase n=1 Tax=Parasphingorhabdus sp. JC815 TaxID=3232140 RepID=UPI003458C4AE